MQIRAQRGSEKGRGSVTRVTLAALSTIREDSMAILRDRPYTSFNFLVDLGDGVTEGPNAGFAEVCGLGLEVEMIEYRSGNARDNQVMKIPGLTKNGDVTLKRGLIGSLSLYKWLDQIRNGELGAMRTVKIQLQNEDHSAVVQTWKLQYTRIVKHTSGPLNARGGSVAIEEVVLACERLEIE